MVPHPSVGGGLERSSSDRATDGADE